LDIRSFPGLVSYEESSLKVPTDADLKQLSSTVTICKYHAANSKNVV